MSLISRRDWLAAVSLTATGYAAGVSAEDGSPVSKLRIASFRCDVTPPLGHPLCGGWIKPVLGVADPLEAIGLVILGAGEPIVVCAVDWTGLLNSAHRHWCESLARAVGTRADRVAVQCVHQHDAPFACLDSQALIRKYPELPAIVDEEFVRRCAEDVARAAEESLNSARRFTHVGVGEAKVDRVAGNRRLPGPDGKLMPMRGSSSKNPEHKRAPEGLIDPLLKTVAFYDGDQKVAACHYYACHPMSHYGQGEVSADFCGLARRRRQQEEPGCTHLYFNGCGGDVAAGKYNDGTAEMRPVLSQRIYDAIVAAEETLKPQPIRSVDWRTADVRLTPDPKWNAEELAAQLADGSRSVVERNRPAFTLAYLERCARGEPITLSALHVNEASVLHLPAECFVDYQLRAQRAAGGRFVACAAYGDGGPWYIPTKAAFPLGGYEVSVSWCGPPVEDELWQGVSRILSAADV